MAKRIKKQAKSDLNTDDELSRLCGLYEDFEDTMQTSLAEMQRCRDFYDGLQWTPDEESALEKTGQAAVVVNLIARKLNYVLGAEVDERTDPQALPRTPAHEDDAQAITDGLRYACDADHFNLTASLVAEDQFIPGVAGSVCEVEAVRDEVKIKFRQVPWDRCWWDPHSRHPLFDDARYKGAVVWMYAEDALSDPQYAGAKEVIEQSFADPGAYNGVHDDKPNTMWVDGSHRRLKICEVYYKRGSVWYSAHFTKAGFLIPPTPVAYLDDYGDSVCPLELCSSYVRDSDGARYGLVKNMMGPQEEVNKRRSKALWLMSVRQFMAEEGAVDSPDEAREQAAMPDGWIVVNDGAMTERRIQQMQTGDLAQGQATLLQESKAEIQQVGADGQLGELGPNVSGRSVLAQQQIANRELRRPFDNHKEWKRRMYMHAYWRMRQFWRAPMWLRVQDDTDDLKGYRFVGINLRMTRFQRFMQLVQKKVDPAAALQSLRLPNALATLQQAVGRVQQMAQQAGKQMQPAQIQQLVAQALSQLPEMQEPITIADVTTIDVDVVIDTAPDTAVIEQEEYDTLSKLAPSLIQAGADPRTIALLVVKASQLRSKRELVKLLEKPTQDPAAAQAAAQAQAKAAALAEAQAKANIGKTVAQANEAQAKAQLTQAEIPGVAPKAQLAQAQAVRHATEAGLALGEAQRPEPDVVVGVVKPPA